MIILNGATGKRMSEAEYKKFTHKICSNCGQVKTVESFYRKSAKTTRGWFWDSHCIECRNLYSKDYAAGNRERRNSRLKKWRKNNPDGARQVDRSKHYRRAYGITVEEADRMKSQNDGKCYICNKATTRLNIDHCHKTGIVRGVLCSACNLFIARINDDPEVAQRMVDYLRHADVLIEIANRDIV